jgi:spermidine synthase
LRAGSDGIAERIGALLRALAVGLRLPPALLPRSLMARTAIDVSEKAGVRYLHFSSAWVQGAMRIQRPYALELPYTREMMAGLLFRDPPWPRSALLIGLGAGSLAKYIYHYLPATKITVVEIDPQVEIVARLHFRLPDDPLRLRIVIADGAEYMLQGDSRFDYVLVDGFDANARAGPLETLPFYQACRSRLSDSGLLAINLLGRERGFQASAARIDEAFDGRSLLFPSCDSGNTIVFATAGEPVVVSFDELISRAEQCKRDTGLNLLPTIAHLQKERYLANDRLRI